ncbi:AAA family ATPase [Pedobacter jeongneungensis]|uniref:AAA family ATPase n=1 Tax=Pedobacter jeongneungensis TaxID=947309 RepID=UPI000468646D|nr:AAA family ATPase [Pedobacter jeongneungensis]
MIYYHFTQTFLGQIRNNQKILDVLENFFQENIDKNSIKGIGKISPFTKSIYVLRSKAPYFEAILEERTLMHKENKLIVYFVRALKNVKNSLQEYVDIRDGKWTEKRPFDIEDEESFLKKLDNIDSNTSHLSKIPEELTSWQNDYQLKITYDIYESDLWVNYAVNNSPKDGMRLEDSKLFLNLLRKIVVQKHKGRILNETGRTTYFGFKDLDFNIELLYIETLVSGKSYIIIFGGSHLNDQVDYNSLLNSKFTELFYTEFKTLQDISQFCLKAYPSWTLKEDELWLKIQKNSEFGNLSLLPEQTSFLENFKFPKYINGQAGSGKSTILYYLFSNIYYFMCAGEIKGDIVFITENEKLLNHTIDSVYDLVLNNPEFQLSSEDADLINLKKHFHSFKNFLRSFLPSSDLFSDETYLDFSKFKSLYEASAINNSLKRRFSAEIIWFTITTYIYGLELNDKLTIDNYDEKMPKEGKEIISKDDFAIIEKEILKPFYDKLILEDQLWNKITLIKYLKDNKLIDKKFEVIFCDESQDFSKIELEFIISLSRYSGYNLEGVNQFPIVFAGDALQTVNPTGFRSEVLTSMIYKSLTNPLVGFNLNQRDLVFTPEYNYRSSPTIVAISNVVQNWRKIDLKEDIKEFQKPKRKNSYLNQNLNIFVDIDAFQNSEELKQKIQFKTIIVPVNNEEIGAFKERHTVLKDFKNIISAIDAKGLDFSEVVIFGFGQLFSENDYGIYEKKYFYNKLYVAVTRTRDELIIIDSKKAKSDFWDVIITSFISTEWNKINHGLSSVDDLLITNSNSIIQSKNTIVEDDAKIQKEIGWVNRNVPLLRIASNHFLKIGNYEEYFFCLGLISEVNEDYLKASEYYLNKELITNLEAKKRALYSLWNGKYFEKIKNIVSIDGLEKKILDSLYSVILIKDGIFDEPDISLFEDNLKALVEVRKNTIWVEEFKDLFLNNIKLDFQRDLHYRIFEILNLVFKEYINNEEKEEVADILSTNGQHSYAISIYDKLGIKGIKYYRSLAEIAKKRRKHEEYILSLGKILYEDFAKNKLEQINKGEIAEEILFYYLENDLESNLDSDDPYYYAYILLSMLYSSRKNTFDGLNEYEQVIAYFSLHEREEELLSFFYYLLQEPEFTNIIYNRTINDWSRLYIKLYGIEELNLEYEILCKIKDVPYIPFFGSGLDHEQNHITSINVRNFKHFEYLEVVNIGLINLVVGDNNIGKTSILEMFLISPDAEQYYKRLLYCYIERSKIIPDKKINSEKIEYVYEIDQDFLIDYLPNQSLLNPVFEVLSGRRISKLNIMIDEGQEVEKGFTALNFTKIKKRNESLPYNETLNQPFYSYGKGYGKDLSLFYDEYIRKDRTLEMEFLENLSLFIPKIEKVMITADGWISIRVMDSNLDKSLHSFGDGANKLFRILLLLTVHKGKMVLIDEIDSGIHFSRFKRFWEIIINIATKDNTQVIASTHNLECINFFAAALSDDNNEKARVIQLLRTNRLKATTYDYHNFKFALEDNFELRG